MLALAGQMTIEKGCFPSEAALFLCFDLFVLPYSAGVTSDVWRQRPLMT
jgi:hypothetical protein